MADRDAQAAAIARQIFLRVFSSGIPTGGVASQLAPRMHEEVVPAGTILFRRGEAANRLFFIVRGRVELAQPGAKTWSFETGAVLGALDVFQDRPHARTAVALTEVQALVLEADDWFDVLEDNFEFTRNSIIHIASSLHELRLTLPPCAGFLGKELLAISARTPPGNTPGQAGPSSRTPAARYPTSAPPALDGGNGRAAEAEGRPLNLVERIIAFRDVAAFKSAGIQALTTMADLIEETRLDAGAQLYAQGDASSAIFVIVRGTLEIERDDPAIRASFGPGSLLAGLGSLGYLEQPYSARALAPSLVLKVDKEDLFDLLEIHFDMVRSVLAIMARERELVLLERVARGLAEAAPF